MAKKPIKVTEVVLRDAHQSLLATRMTMDEMRPILPEMDKINYFSVECWGGATFDSCIQMCIRDRQKTVKKLDEAYNYVKEVAAEGGDILSSKMIFILFKIHHFNKIRKNILKQTSFF